MNTCFKHYMYFVYEFNLIPRKEELAPLQELIDRLLERDQPGAGGGAGASGGARGTPTPAAGSAASGGAAAADNGEPSTRHQPASLS